MRHIVEANLMCVDPISSGPSSYDAQLSIIESHFLKASLSTSILATIRAFMSSGPTILPSRALQMFTS